MRSESRASALSVPEPILTQKSILKEINSILQSKKLLEIESVRIVREVREDWPQVTYRIQIRDIANSYLVDFYLRGSLRNIDFFTVLSEGMKHSLRKSLAVLCKFLKENGYPNQLKDWESIPDE
ncbi:MAG: hypothetical protein V1690_03190 [Candidatus Moraniibacteriota bacterium]